MLLRHITQDETALHAYYNIDTRAVLNAGADICLILGIV